MPDDDPQQSTAASDAQKVEDQNRLNEALRPDHDPPPSLDGGRGDGDKGDGGSDHGDSGDHGDGGDRGGDRG